MSLTPHQSVNKHRETPFLIVIQACPKRLRGIGHFRISSAKSSADFAMATHTFDGVARMPGAPLLIAKLHHGLGSFPSRRLNRRPKSFLRG